MTLTVWRSVTDSAELMKFVKKSCLLPSTSYSPFRSILSVNEGNDSYSYALTQARGSTVFCAEFVARKP